jgi:hypothetical protein
MKKILLLIFICLIATSLRAESPGSIDLDGSAIDLLVGAPEGVVEPLDERRTRVEEDEAVDFSSFLSLDSEFETANSEYIIWQDAEEDLPSKDEQTTTYLDLISEVEDMDDENFTDFEIESDSNISDSVETGLKL